MDRYLGGRVAYMPHANGNHVPVVLRKPQRWPQQTTITYTVTAADHMWTLADHYYSNSLDWWAIADLNYSIPCPDDMRWGDVLALPVA